MLKPQMLLPFHLSALTMVRTVLLTQLLACKERVFN
jgi:hypothetical protein